MGRRVGIIVICRRYRYVGIASMISDVSVISGSLSYFPDCLTLIIQTNSYMSKTENLIWQYSTSLHLRQSEPDVDDMIWRYDFIHWLQLMDGS